MLSFFWKEEMDMNEDIQGLRLWLLATEARFLTGETEVREDENWNQIHSPDFPELSRNEIVLARMTEDPDLLIDKALREYRGLPLKWCVSPYCAPSDLGERLLKRGFRDWGARLMGCPTNLEVNASLHGIEEVTKETLRDFASCFCQGWAIDEQYQTRVTEDLAWSLETGRFRYFFAQDKGQLVATAGLLMGSRGAYLMGAQVLAKARGRGFYRALIRARLRALAELGITKAWTQAREASSAPILESLGFETLFRFRCYAKDRC